MSAPCLPSLHPPSPSSQVESWASIYSFHRYLRSTVPDTGQGSRLLFFSYIHASLELNTLVMAGEETSNISIRSDGSVMETNKAGKGGRECRMVG